jgi:uncharacterized membrane protein
MSTRTLVPPAQEELVAQETPVSPVFAWVALGFSLFGAGVATYLTLAHYTKAVSIVCPVSLHGAINCEKVTTSPQSMVFGIPVAVLGLGYFLTMIVLNLPVMWRSYSKELAVLRMALAVSGIGFVLYLLAMELFVIKAICLWCTSTHIMAFGLLVTIAAGTTNAWPYLRSRAELRAEEGD